MMCDLLWLPELILMQDHDNQWSDYVEAIYVIYKKDFIDTNPTFQGKVVSRRVKPVVDEKDYTFWHITHEGDVEEERIPNIRRCERIAWPKAFINNFTKIYMWENVTRTKKGKQQTVLLYLEDERYLVILRKRSKYYLFVTAYIVAREKRHNDLLKEYKSYKNKTGDATKVTTPHAPSTYSR